MTAGGSLARRALERSRYELASGLRGVALPPIRRRLLMHGSGVRLPRAISEPLDLDGTLAAPLRVEIGSGPYPRDGYVHVDQDWHSRHLEHRKPMWDLPFESSSVREILAIHTLEHVHPSLIGPTLQEWHRVLQPGGLVEIHVPNAAALLRTYEAGSRAAKWAASAVIYGYGGGPQVTSPDDVALLPFRRPTHRTLFDLDLMTELLESAGYVQIEDLTGVIKDRHSQQWENLVPGYSLVVRARRDGAR